MHVRNCVCRPALVALITVLALMTAVSAQSSSVGWETMNSAQHYFGDVSLLHVD